MRRFSGFKRYRGRYTTKSSGRSLALLLLLLFVAAFSMWHVFKEMRSAYRDKHIQAALSESVSASREEIPGSSTMPENFTLPEDDTQPENSADASTPEPEATEEVPLQILPQFQELYAENDELFGWIKIDGTSIDYPVMHTPNDAEKYLHLNFNGEYSAAGTIFLDYRCQSDSDNLIIHGHRMRNGSMFADIVKYTNESYWKEHPVIHFDTLYKQQEYEVLAAFYDRVYLNTDTCFKFYNFIDAENAAEFDEAISYYKENALYDTGVTAEYGDSLITLSTCSYHVENGRFVVVAKELK